MTNTTSADATTGGAGAPAMLTPSTMSRTAAAATVAFVAAAAAGRSRMHRAVRYRATGHTRTRLSRGRGYDQGRHGCAHSAHSRDACRSPPLLRRCLAQGWYQCLYTRLVHTGFRSAEYGPITRVPGLPAIGSSHVYVSGADCMPKCKNVQHNLPLP